MQLFIDTNIFLSFYHFKSDDLEELKKLSVLLRRQEVDLLLTDQVVNEFNRNRENKIADAIRRLKDQRFNLQFPQLCKDYEEYEKLRDYQKQYEQEHNALLNKITKDVKRKTLKADIIIDELFNSGKLIKTTDKIISLARLRVEIGNPPGKNGSLGDAINWEALLANASSEEDIYFITDDKDYYSPIDTDTFNEFLLQDWDREKGSQILYFKQLSGLFKKSFPDIKLASELEKDFLIQELFNSANFMQTHRVISKLSSYTDFTSAQINRIVEAVISNSQVYWIIKDEDIEEFLLRTISGKENDIDRDNLELLGDALSEEDEPAYFDEDESPF